MPRELEVKDEKGLTLTDRKVIQEIAINGSWQKAADSLGIPRRRVRAMLREPAFKEAYDTLFDTEEMEITKRELEIISQEVAPVYEDAIKAEMFKTVTCPHCGKKHDVQVVDHSTRVRAADNLLKMNNIWKDTKSLKIDAEMRSVSVQLTGDQYLALQRLKQGFNIPEHVHRELLAIDKSGEFGVPPLPDAIDGQYRVMEEESDNAHI